MANPKQTREEVLDRDPEAIVTDQTLIDEAQGTPPPKSKMVEVQAARPADVGVDYVEVWDVAEADKEEHKESKLAGSRVLDVPNEEHDSAPLTVAVAPDFKGTIVKTDTGMQVIGG